MGQGRRSRKRRIIEEQFQEFSQDAIRRKAPALASLSKLFSPQGKPKRRRSRQMKNGYQRGVTSAQWPKLERRHRLLSGSED